MTILAVGGEASTYELPAGHQYLVNATAGGPYDPALSRCSMTLAPGTSELILPFAPQTEIFLHFYLNQKDVAVGDYIFIRNSAGTEDQYRIKMLVDGKWELSRYDGAAFVSLFTTSSIMVVNNHAYIDIHIKQDNVNGTAEIFLDTVSVGSFTGNTSSPSTMGQVRFVGLTGGTSQMDISQVIVGTTTLLNYRLGTQSIDSDGALTTWTGDYTSVDEIVPNSNDFVEVNNVNALQSFGVTGVPAAFNTYNIKGVVVGMRMSIDNGSVVNDNELLVRTGGTEYLSGGVGMTKDGSLQSKQYVWETNPATGQPWTVGELASVEIGVKSI